MLPEVKLFGYMTPTLMEGLREFNRHLKPNGQIPVWLFSCDDNTKAVRFYPGQDRLKLMGGQWILAALFVTQAAATSS